LQKFGCTRARLELIETELLYANVSAGTEQQCSSGAFSRKKPKAADVYRKGILLAVLGSIHLGNP
jgi:hypothetical protein